MSEWPTDIEERVPEVREAVGDGSVIGSIAVNNDGDYWPAGQV